MSAPPSTSAFLAITALMFVSGIGIPVMATLNGRLGQQLANPAAATLVLFIGGLLLSGIAVAFAGLPSWNSITTAPRFLYLGPVFIVFYVLAITWASPRIGVGNAVFFVLLGQLIAAAAIDHLALFGALRTTLTPRRAAGIAVMALGVYLARKPR